VNNPTGIRNKPDIGGLWTSPTNSNCSWFAWSLQANFRTNLLKVHTDLVVSGSILELNSLSDLEGLPLIPTAYGRQFPVLDFVKLASVHDAIHLTVERLYELDSIHNLDRFDRTDLPDFYGWDCETVLILNKSAIMIKE
jgi:hypothetical protein